VARRPANTWARTLHRTRGVSEREQNAGLMTGVHDRDCIEIEPGVVGGAEAGEVLDPQEARLRDPDVGQIE
jgi:hypothetical protein